MLCRPNISKFLEVRNISEAPQGIPETSWAESLCLILHSSLFCLSLLPVQMDDWHLETISRLLRVTQMCSQYSGLSRWELPHLFSVTSVPPRFLALPSYV